MNKTLPTAIYAVLSASILTALAGCADQQSFTQPQSWAAQETGIQATTPEPTDANGILQRMANYLAKTQAFSVNLSDSYDTVQASGEKIEFSSTRKVLVSRPNGLRVEHEASDGEKQIVLYDGKDITVFSPADNVYAQTAKPGGIDEAVKYFLKDLNMRLPLAVLLVSQLPTELESRTESLAYVEKSMVNGQQAHHLAARTQTVDYQV